MLNTIGYATGSTITELGVKDGSSKVIRVRGPSENVRKAVEAIQQEVEKLNGAKLLEAAKGTYLTLKRSNDLHISATLDTLLCLAFR